MNIVQDSLATEVSPLEARRAATTRVRHPRSSWWVYLILIAVVAGFGYFIYTRLVSAKAAASAESEKHRPVHDLPVVVVAARLGDLDQYLIGLGTVTPSNVVTVKSRVDGAITKIAFTEGQMVHQGDLLLEIDSRPYEAALKQARGQLAKDQAARESADWNVQQDELAIQDKGISQQVLHNDKATRDQVIGAIEIDQAAIDNAQLNLSYARITSPINGRIGLRLIDVGNIVHAGDSGGLAVITQLEPITVVFNLPEDNIAQIQKRMNSGEPLIVEAYDRDLAQKLASGKLLAIDNQIDSTTGTVKIKAIYGNSDHALFPSQFVNARLLVNTVHDAVLIPTVAIQHSPTSAFVYVVSPAAKPSTTQGTTKEAQVVSMREIVPGPSQSAIGSEGEDTTVVAVGLQQGEIVVTDGVDKLLDGSKVLPAFSNNKRGAATRQSNAQPSGASSRGMRRRGSNAATQTP